ncbi:MAG: hypothetical protein ACLQJR_11040 [Stellaceae bacterium]
MPDLLQSHLALKDHSTARDRQRKEVCEDRQRLSCADALSGALRSHAVFDLHDPVLDWASLAEGMGVEASRASSAEEFAAQFSAAMAGRSPRLIEAVISR